MAGYLIPHDAWERIAPLLPSRPVGQKGGRPPIGDREVLTGIIFVLKTGIPWEELPLELGCGCGMTCLRRLRFWQQSGTWPEIQTILEEGLRTSRQIDWKRLRGTSVSEESQDAVISGSQTSACDETIPLSSFVSFERQHNQPADDSRTASRVVGG